MTFSDPTIEAAKTQTTQGLVLQGYCNSILQQPFVDFSEFTNLSKIQTNINDGLQNAKDNAKTYLNGIQNNIISNINSISNFYNLYSAVPTVLPPDATEAQWLSILQAMKSQTDTFIEASDLVIIDLGNLNSNINADVAFFNKTINDLNAIVGGNDGMLASLDKDIERLDKQIAGTIAGTVISGLAIVGGAVMIGVGTIGSPFTAGGSTPLIAGGVAVVLVGTAGTVASALTLKGLYDAKASVLQQKSSLTSEVNLAEGIKSGYSSLGFGASEAVTATSQMKNAWVSINSDLDNLSLNLQNGIISTDSVRQLFLTAANETIPFILEDVSLIKQQMAGVNVSVSAEDMNVGEYAVHLAEQATAA